MTGEVTFKTFVDFFSQDNPKTPKNQSEAEDLYKKYN